MRHCTRAYARYTPSYRVKEGGCRRSRCAHVTTALGCHSMTSYWVLAGAAGTECEVVIAIQQLKNVRSATRLRESGDKWNSQTSESASVCLSFYKPRELHPDAPQREGPPPPCPLSERTRSRESTSRSSPARRDRPRQRPHLVRRHSLLSTRAGRNRECPHMVSADYAPKRPTAHTHVERKRPRSTIWQENATAL